LNKLAREQSREVVILYRHPVLTSARKIRLYSRGEGSALCVRRFSPAANDQQAAKLRSMATDDAKRAWR